MNKPKILLYDLETAGVNAFYGDLAFMVNFGYKWYGEEETHALVISDYDDWFQDHQLNDKGIVQDALKIIEEADLVVAHYGEKFDRRFLQARAVIHGLTPPPPTKMRDTWRMLRTSVAFRSNRLGDSAVTLGCKEQKYVKKADEWPGWWHRTLGGDPDAPRLMAEYCKQDVRTLECLYGKMRLYDDPHPRLYDDKSVCRLCGSSDLHYRPNHYSHIGENKYCRFQCKTCGKWDRDRTAAKEGTVCGG